MLITDKNYRQKKTELSSVFSVRDWKGSKVRISLAPWGFSLASLVGH